MPSLPDPLHPALVHLPLGLALALPLVVLYLSAARWRGRRLREAWVGLFLLHGVLFGAAYWAVESGEDEEERVEAVVPSDALHEHEDRAEGMLWAVGATTAVVLLAALVGATKLGGFLAGLALALSLATAVLALRTGEAGGALVYEHGAAEAYR